MGTEKTAVYNYTLGGVKSNQDAHRAIRRASKKDDEINIRTCDIVRPTEMCAFQI